MANIALLKAYVLIWIVSTLLISLFVLYLKSKPIDHQNFKDLVQTDLAYCVWSYITFVAIWVYWREFVGPSHSSFLTDLALLLFLIFYYSIMTLIVSNQLVQFFGIFYANVINLTNESILLAVHRILSLGFGCAFGGLICCLKSGVCWKGPVRLYFVIDETDEPYRVPFANMIGLVIFMGTIVACQAAVEVKRYRLNRQDDMADELAAEAQAQIEEAVNKMQLEKAHAGALHAWENRQENLSGNSNINKTPTPTDSVHINLPTISICPRKTKPRRKGCAKEQAARSLRFYTIYGVFSSSVVLGMLSVTNLDVIRPHGTIMSMFVFLGIVSPIIALASNKKLRLFAKELITSKMKDFIFN